MRSLQNTQGAWSLNSKSYLAKGVSSLPTLGGKMVRIWGFGRRTGIHVK